MLGKQGTIYSLAGLFTLPFYSKPGSPMSVSTEIEMGISHSIWRALVRYISPVALDL